jgi:imidazolonepropionase-like amidohydrolase
MKDAGTYLVPTLWGTEYSLQESLRSASTEGGERERLAMLSPRHRSSFQKALGAGVKLAFGTDSGSMPHALNATEFQLMADLGMPPLDAIRAATIWAADLLRRSADLGSIQPGRHADLIAVRGDPLTNLGLLRAPEFVMKGGRVVSHRGEGA